MGAMFRINRFIEPLNAVVFASQSQPHVRQTDGNLNSNRLHIFFTLIISLHTLEFPIILNLSLFDLTIVSLETLSGFISLLILQFSLVLIIVSQIINKLSQNFTCTFRNIEKWLIFSFIISVNCGLTYFIGITTLY